MNASLPPEPPDFLSGDPAPVTPGGDTPQAGDSLPQDVADHLLGLPGIDGAWIERDAQGGRVVVLHCSLPEPPAGLPRQVDGLPTRIIGGEPIRAQ